MKNNFHHRNYQIQISNESWEGFCCLIYLGGECHDSTNYYPTEEAALEKAKEKIDYFLDNNLWLVDI